MLYAIGDIHGHYEALVRLLHGANLIDSNLHWAGDDNTLVFMGDFVDRGPAAPEAIALVMRLQSEATALGGSILSVMGNHDLLLTLVARSPDAPSGSGETFYQSWERNGGIDSDLDRLTPPQIEWLAAQPAMLRVDDILITHADALFYYEYGQTVHEVNRAFATLLANHDLPQLAKLNDQFGKHRDFWGTDGTERAAQFLSTYGGSQLWHGHTPIHGLLKVSAQTVTEPLIYANGLCVNLDGGIYSGGSGFVYRNNP